MENLRMLRPVERMVAAGQRLMTNGVRGENEPPRKLPGQNLCRKAARVAFEQDIRRERIRKGDPPSRKNPS